MAFCTNCGNQLGEADKFCSKCGTPVKKIEAPAVTPAAPAAPTAQPTEIPVAQPTAPVVSSPVNTVNVSDVKTFVKNNKKKVAVAAAAFVAFIVLFIVIVSSLNNCEVKGCNRNHAKGADYCYSHKCAKTNCDNRRLSSGIYCSTHKTTSSSSSSSSASSAVNAILDLKFSNIKIQHNSLYTVVTGTITNNGSKNYKFVTVKGAFKDSSGKVVDTDSTYAVGSEGLAKGESKQFRMSIDKNTKVKSCTVTLTGYK